MSIPKLDCSQTIVCYVYRTINTQSDHLTFQKDLEALEKWASDWGMRLNAKKCYLMSFNSRSSHDFYTLNNHILQKVKQNPYLGILISEDHKWEPHLIKITKKAKSTLAFLKRNLRHCPELCRRTAYISLVLGLELAIDPPPPRGNFVHYDFLKLHYIRHKIKDVSPLRVAALTCNSTLYTLPPKIAINIPDNVSTITC